jgi:nucleoid-associated protein EbfC
MTNFMEMLQKFQEAQKGLQKLNEELQAMSVTGTAGGGMVTAEVNGRGQLRSIRLDPSVVNPADVEMLEDLLVVAVSDAQKKAESAAESQVSQMTGGMSLPFKLPF